MKKILKVFLICICFGVMLSGFAGAAGETEEPKELKILAIGNSFSVDAMEYLWDIANDGGYKFTLGNLYIGGCSLDTHAKNIEGNKAAYAYFKNTSGSWSKTESTSIATAIADEDWDIITVQQSSPSSGVASSYSKLSDILTYLEKVAPSAKVYFHMTWAYQGDSTHSGFANYNKDQITMYNAILSAVDSEVKTKKNIVGIIPSGTAIQNLRTSYIGDTVTRDGYHLSYSYGRYTAALTWYAYFTGADITEIDWVPDAYYTLLTKDINAVREAVNGAINNPYKITTVTAKDPGKLSDAEIIKGLGHNINGYKKLDWVFKIGAYYNAESGFNANDTASNSPNFIASYQYTKDMLPYGTIILMDEGYKYRPEGWIGEDYVCSASERAPFCYDGVVEIDEEWWGKYTHRAFNLSTTPTTRKMTYADIKSLRIYVPLYPDLEIVDTADINSDGSVDVKDVLISLNNFLNREGKASDMDGDGLIDLLDVLLLLKETL